MAKGPDDFRDPKVTNTKASNEGGVGKKVGIAIAVIVLLLLLAWLLGLFGNDEVDTSVTPAENDATVVEPAPTDAAPASD